MTKRKKIEKGMYWTDVVEEKIREYIQTKCPRQKSFIYSKYLMEPLETLVYSIMYTYHLFIENESDEDLKNEVISHIIEVIDNFDCTRQTKAYSYLGTTVKNCLIQKKNKYAKEVKQKIYISVLQDYEFLDNLSYKMYDKQNNKKMEKLIVTIERIIKEASNQKIKSVMEALLNIIEKRESLGIQNKQQLFFCLREYTDFNTIDISKALKFLRTYQIDYI